MKEFLLLHGPNLDLLGVREPEIYGKETLASFEALMKEYASVKGARIVCFQSNHEGELIEAIHDARLIYDGIIYNPGAHTHYSYALRDAIGAVGVPAVEVHLSDVAAREAFRSHSVIAPVCVAQIKGKGIAGYFEAFDILMSGATERLGEGFERKYSGRAIVASAVLPTASAACEGSDGHVATAADTPLDALSRINRLRAVMSQQEYAAFYVRDVSNIKWLAAFDEVFDDEDAHAMMITSEAAALHTDTRYGEACVLAARGTGITIDTTPQHFTTFAAETFSATCDTRDCDRVLPRVLGIESSIALSEYRRLTTAFEAASASPRIAETSGIIVGLRAVKDAVEIARIKAAQAITDAAFAHIIGCIRPGMTERAIQIELEDFMVRHGASGLAFSSIVATGANGASPHAIPGETVLEAGQCVVLDFGARAFGYCSDMTRTVFLGEPDGVMARAWETVRRANETVEDMLCPGVTGAAAHARAEEVLADGGFANAMGHGLGHGVGIDIHEQPVLSVRNEAPLVCGNVVTVEPGIYRPGEFGMRLEDFGVITHDGFEVFTQSTHETVIL
ncbi:MAG: type II 3-dehydroquinate dehydratase [Raoultibacter sp.]